MKNRKKNFESFDQIVFKDRNKNYGAFYLRTIYKKSMSKAVIIGITIFLVMITIPLIGNYLANKHRILKHHEDITPIIRTYDPKKDDHIIPPPKKEEIKDIIKKVVFRLQIVRQDQADTTTFTMDDINDKNKNRHIDSVFTEIPVKERVKDNDIDIKPDSIFHYVEEIPTYQGGESALFGFLASNVHYPQVAINYGVQGIVYVAFVVEKDGSLSNFRAVTKLGAGCDDEAVRVSSMMKKWNPGRQNGKCVRVEVVLPVKFQLLN